MNKIDYTVRSPLEAKALTLINEFLSIEGNWSPTTAMVGIVFRAMYSSALTKEYIARVGKAIVGMPEDAALPDLDRALRVMVRSNVLRTYLLNNERRWEVAL
jgi:hypothetical protein